MTIFSGILSTPMSPFDAEGRFAPAYIDGFVAWQVRSGVTGFFCLGTWGGFALLDLEERRRATRVWCEIGRRHGARVLIQVAAFALHDTLALVHEAEDAGATAVASVAPLYYSAGGYYTLDDFKRYFAALAKATKLPLFLYNNPRTTGILFKPAEFVGLVGVGVAGVKDGSKDAGWILEAQDRLAESGLSAEIIPGNTVALVYAAAAGLEAAMSGAAVTFPRLTSQTWDALKRGDFATGARLHRTLMKTRRAVARLGMPAIVSYGLLRAMGHDLGCARTPWPPACETSIPQLLDELRLLGVPDAAG